MIGPTSLVTSRCANTTWSTISAVVRCLFKPILKFGLFYQDAACGKQEHLSYNRRTSNKEDKTVPASVAELTVHGTTHLT